MSLSLIASTIAVGVNTTASTAATQSLAITKQAPQAVLVAEPLTYTVVASNPPDGGDDDMQYNLTVRDVLPAGVTYVSTSSPRGAGDPQQIPEVVGGTATGRTILVWTNLADLPNGSDVSLTYTVRPDPDVYRVGSTIQNQATAYSSNDERKVARFDANGTFRPDPAMVSDQAAASTQVTAIEVRKSEPSPEGELMRGAHDRTTTYALTVRNNASAPTEAITVVDYVAAGLEFLGCGQVDNSSGPEYQAAASLDQTPQVPDCLEPESVTTVQNPDGYPAGVYTRVQWRLADGLGADASRTIRYAAAIALRENQMPAQDDFVSTANLDNNTGPSTRESATARSYTNRVEVRGTYTGQDNNAESNTQVVARDSYTVTAQDLSVVKTAPGAHSFTQDGEVTFNLAVRSSEYVNGSDIVLVDTLPDGLCPADAPASVYTPAAAAQASGDCAPGGNNPRIAKVDVVDAKFQITFAAFDLTAAQASTTVSYTARMRSQYVGGGSTSASDTYVNSVRLTGTTTAVDRSPEEGSQQVADESQVELSAAAPTLDKRALPNRASGYRCDESDWAAWEASLTGADDDPFEAGSRVCFQVRVQFPEGSATRNPVITDFLPDNLRYEPGSFQLVRDVNTVELTQSAEAIETALTAGSLVLRPGQQIDGARYVPRGQTLAFVVAGTVTSNDTSVDEVGGNLAKLRWTDHAGKVLALRDTSDFKVPPTPELGVDKAVAVAPFESFADNQVAVQGQTAQFRIRLTNNSAVTPVSNVAVWDVLPAPFTCDDVTSPLSGGGACTDPGDAGHPNFDANDVRSAIRWSVAGPLGPGERHEIAYRVVVPVGTSVATSYTNTAHVVQYQTPTNDDDVVQTHFPRENISNDVPQQDQTAPQADDSASLTLPEVGLTKANLTGVNNTSSDKNGPTQAVPGEQVTYTLRAVIPAKTTVYSGVLTDTLPAAFTLTGATWAFLPDATSSQTGPQPQGVSFDASTLRLALPSTYQNSTDTDQVFQVVATGVLKPGHTATAAVRNTTRFNSTTTAGGQSKVPEKSATSSITPIYPSPSLTKGLTGTQNSAPVIGDVREFQLRATNASGRPTLFDTVVADCVPAGLSVETVGPGGSAAPYENQPGCPAGTGTVITWQVGSVAAAQTKTLTYTVKVGPGAVGAQRYVNTVRLTGSSLDGFGNDSTREQVITRDTSATLTVPSASVTKAIADDTLKVGEKAEYTLTALLPANVNFFDASIIDTLPAGLSVSTLQTASVACTNADGTTCVVPEGGVSMTPSGQSVGWFLGDLEASNQARRITIKFSATVDVAVPGNQRGQVRSNSAKVAWNQSNSSTTPQVNGTFDASVPSNTVTYTITEPTVAIDKTVSTSSPAPGVPFEYTVTATNSADANVSTAYRVTVTDVVPQGVVVDVDSISDGGAYDAAARTITWTVSTIAPGARAQLTYGAALERSTSLDGSALVNTAKVAQYASLESGGREYVGPSATATVRPAFPHVSVQKSVDGSDVSYVGAPQNFTITVTSDGDSPAYDVDVTDVLPKNWNFDAGSATVKVGSGAATPLPPRADAANPQTLTWANLAQGGLPVGDRIQIRYTATPNEDALDDAGAGSTIKHTNTAAVKARDQNGDERSNAATDPQFYGDPASADAYIHSADVSMTKTAKGTPIAGKPFSWDIAVRNLGQDPAVGPIVVTDHIPDGLTDVTMVDADSAWECSLAQDEFTCVLDGPLASGASAPALTVTGTVDSDLASGTELTNTADVTGKTYDPNTGNNSSTSTVKISTLADVKIVKRTVGDVVAGEAATWTLDVTNVGPSTARAPFTVTDTLPGDAEYVDARGPGWSCTHEDGVITCVRTTDLAVGQSAGQITVKATISASQTDAVVNQATVRSTSPEPETDEARQNNTSIVSTDPERKAHVTIEKALEGDEPVVAGDVARYQITVRNEGPSTATNVVVTDQLADYMTFVEGGSPQWTCTPNGQEVRCTFDGTLNPDQQTLFTLSARVASGHTDDVENRVKVTATEDPPGDEDTDVNTPDVKSDLRIDKSHDADIDVVAGESVTYSLRITNDGPSDTDGPITVVDSVPTGLKYDSVSGAGWTCEAVGARVECENPSGLANGESTTFDLTFDVAAAAGPATLVNRAHVDGPHEDPTPSNNTDDDPTQIIDRANVRVVKMAGAQQVTAGDTVTWTLAVHNDGSSVADAVSVADALGEGLTITSISSQDSAWDCDNDTALCTRAALAPTGGTPSVITVVTRVGSGVDAGQSLTNAATVSTSTSGDDPDDNTSGDQVEVVTNADMSIVKSHEGTPVAGSEFRFTMRATNNGPSDARAPIQITDTLPVGMTYVGVNDAWSCVAGPTSNDGQEVDCTRVDQTNLLPGQSAADLVMRVDVAADQSGRSLTNRATTSSATPDDEPSNNTDTDTVTPGDRVDVSITKSHTGPVRIGDELTFQVRVANAGPSQARDVSVRDLLPDALTLVQATGEGWTCEGTDCSLDAPLGPESEAATIAVTVKVAADAYPQVSNVAQVQTSSNDTDDSNNRATDEVEVPAQVDLKVTKKLKGKLSVGQQGTYELTVTNNGPTEDPGPITVTDALPRGLDFVSGRGDGWQCDARGRNVECVTDAPLASGQSRTISLVVDVNAAAYPQVTNTASVSTPSQDTDPSNNADETTSPVAGNAVLAISKTLSKRDGDKATWTIKVTNQGPTQTTQRVRVTDVLPPELALVKISARGWTCTPGRRVVCDFDGVLAVGGTATIGLLTTIKVNDGSRVVNTATARGGNADGDLPPVSDSDSVAAPQPNGLIPNTGGPTLWATVIGLLAVLAGAALMRRSRGHTD